jgi:hypothetical protein
VTEKFNLNTLGTNYTILDKDTKQTESIRVIDAQELYSLIGEYTGKDYGYAVFHTAEILKRFRGFAHSPHHISWYSARAGQFDLTYAIAQARVEGNQVLIIEKLPDEPIDKVK